MANSRIKCNRKYEDKTHVYDDDIELFSLLPACSDSESKVSNCSAVTCLASVREGVCLIGYDDATVRMYNFYEGKELHHWMKHQQPITRVAFNMPEQVAVSVSRDRSMIIWREGQLQPLQVIQAHTLPITGLAISPDGSTICTGSRDNTLKLWDLKTGRQLSSCNISRNVVTHLKWSSQSSTIGQASEDKQLRLWDSRSLQIIHSFPTQQYIQTAIDISQNDKYILTGNNGTNGAGCQATKWDVRKYEMVKEFHGHNQTITGCLFLPLTDTYVVCEHPQLVTISLDKTVRVWDDETAGCLTILRLDNHGPLNDIVDFNDGSVGIATHQKGVLRLFRVRKNNGQWILHPVSSF